MTTTPGPTGAVAALWGTTAAARPGPRPRLTVRGIAEAAVRIADAEGLAAVSMARVAELLGVTTMALYRYVSSKDELLAVVSDVAVPPPADVAADGPWRERLERWTVAQLDVVRRRPWVAELALPPVLGPHRVAWMEQGLAALDGTGLPEGTKVAVIGALSLHVLTAGQVEAAAAAHRRDDPSSHPALLDYAAMLDAVVDPATAPHLARALQARAFSTDGADEPGTLTVALLLDGVAALVARHGDHDLDADG